MSTARRLCSAAVLGSMLVVGCTSPKSVVEPPVETPTPPVDAIPTGPPPGYVKPTNYWVRERIILTSEPAPPAQKRVGTKGKKHKKTGKPVTERMEFRG